MVADALYRGRDWVSTLLAALVLGLLALATVQKAVRVDRDEPVLAVTLFQEEAPKPVEPPPPSLPPPHAIREPTRTAPVYALPTPMPAEPMSAEPIASPKDMPPPVAPSPPRPIAEAPSPAPREVAAPATAAIEAGYLSRLRAYLESTRRYPTSREARSLRPQGKVRLWLDIARDGQLRDAGIEQSSGSMILDGAALSTARQGAYPAWPAEAYAGRTSQRFHVTLDYQLEGG